MSSQISCFDRRTERISSSTRRKIIQLKHFFTLCDRLNVGTIFFSGLNEYSFTDLGENWVSKLYWESKDMQKPKKKIENNVHVMKFLDTCFSY